jgi:hypothetical protein
LSTGGIGEIGDRVEGVGDVDEEEEEDRPGFSCPVESSPSFLS